MYILADIIIISGLLTIVAAIALTCYSIFHSLRVNKRESKENGVPVGILGWSIVALLLVIFIPAFLIGSLANACLITTLAMFCIAAAALTYSKINTHITRRHV